MNILYYDLTYPIGHKYFDEKMIENIAEVSNLTVLCPPNWYRKNAAKATYLFAAEELPYEIASTKRIFLNAIHNTCQAKQVIKEKSIDGIVIGKFDHFSIPFVLSILGDQSPIFLIHHNEIDQLNVPGIKGKIKRLFFSRIKDKVIHCVLEDFIKGYLVEKEKINKDHVCCWPHPVEREIDHHISKKTYDCIGISTSNNSDYISSICENEKVNEEIKNRKFRVVLRSKNTEFDNGYLKIYSGWISDEEYKNYYNNTRSVLIAFKEGYHYRVSASIFDAFSHHIPVLCTDMPLARYYKNVYSDICVIVDKSLPEAIENIKISSVNEMERQFNCFWEAHSDKTIQAKVYHDFNKVINKRKRRKNAKYYE